MLLWSLVSFAYRNIFSAYLSQGSCCSKSSYLKVSLLIMAQCETGHASDAKGSRESPGPSRDAGTSNSTGPRKRSRSRSSIVSPSYEDIEKALEIARPYPDTEEHKWVTLACDILPFWEKMMNQDDVQHFVTKKTRKKWSHLGATRLHSDAGNKVYEVVVMVGLAVHHKLMAVEADIDYGPEGKRKLQDLSITKHLNREHMGDILEAIMGLAWCKEYYGQGYEGFEHYSEIINECVNEVHDLWTSSETLMNNDLNTEDDLAEMVRAVWEQKHSYWYSLQCLKAHEAKLSQIASSSQSQQASSSQSQPQSATSENRASALEAFQTNELLRITGQEDAR